MHKPPIYHKLIIKIEIFVLLLCLIFADRHGTICFPISTAVPEL